MRLGSPPRPNRGFYVPPIGSGRGLGLLSTPHLRPPLPPSPFLTQDLWKLIPSLLKGEAFRPPLPGEVVAY